MQEISRKQEIYREILQWALPVVRNGLSRFRGIRPLVVLSARSQRSLHSDYEIAEFIHGIPIAILEGEFTDYDVFFLNHHARSFFERNNDEQCSHYSLFAYYIQELFKEVPESKKSQLTWTGPTLDYAWARPKSGYELIGEADSTA